MNFVNNSIFGLMYPQWLTPSPMIKEREPIKRFCEASSPSLWSLCKGCRVVGWRSYPPCYGVSTLPPTDLWVTRPSSWFTELRRFSLVTSDIISPVWQLILKLIMKKDVRMHLTCWMRSVTSRRLVRQFTSKICVVITAAGLKPEPFKKAIWCSGLSRIRLICINYPHLGKGLLCSAKI